MGAGQLTGIIAAVIAAVAGVATLGFYGGVYTGASETAALRQKLDTATNAKGAVEIMASLQKLSDASNNLFRFEQHAQEIANLQSRISDLESAVSKERQRSADLQKTVKGSELALADALTQRDEAMAELKKRYSVREEFTLNEGQSFSLFDGRQSVGLESVVAIYASIVTPSGRRTMYVGETEEWKTAHTVCRLTLKSITKATYSSTFLVLCD